MSELATKIGLVGAGLLGGAIAQRLAEKGRGVLAYDIDPQRLAALAPSGVAASPSADDVLRQCEIVLLSLPTSQVVGQLLDAHRGALRAGSVIVDTTTGDPAEMIEHGRQLRELGVAYVEATVAGSSAQLRAGAARLFVGGDEEAVRRIGPLLDCLADVRFYLGGVGAASRFKLVHNLVLGLHRAVLAEGLTFAAALGFEPGQTLEILQQTPAASSVMATKGPKMVAGDWTPQARLSQHLKDVRLLLAEAAAAGAPTPLSRAHRALLERAEALGFGDADNSAVIEAYHAGPAEQPA
jgi:3-hydroxyisobutyrate dehydrogenase-like beta-hydroxyacid dehydrogenase